MSAPRPPRVPRLLASLVPGLALVASCASVGPTRELRPSLEAARALPAWDGATGEALAFDALVARAAEAEVVVVGEQHDDAMGHAFQAALFEALLERAPGTALSLEMLERDEQAFVDDYLDGILDRERFLRRAPLGWSGGERWEAWYQPLLDRAREAGARVIAANAPRRYVRWVKTEGFDGLAGLPPGRRELATAPPEPSSGVYVEKFREFLRKPHTEGEAELAPEEEWTPEERAAFEERFEASFRSQSLWDATMADSVARALEAGVAPIMHLVGQFHSDFDGGLLQQLRHLRPATRTFVISMQPRGCATLDEEDRGRADAVVDTGG